MAQIAIDGPAGVGKSTAARRVADRLGFVYIDTGAMYRAVGLAAHRRGVDMADEAALAALTDGLALELRLEGGLQRVALDGEDVTDAIRLPECGMFASDVARHPGVRVRLVAMQRRLAEGRDVVMDGRDIGAVVLPNAELKVYLTASIARLAERRCAELAAKGVSFDAAEVGRETERRVRQDRERAASPDKPADGAVTLDTAELDERQVEDEIVRLYYGSK